MRKSVKGDKAHEDVQVKESAKDSVTAILLGFRSKA